MTARSSAHLAVACVAALVATIGDLLMLYMGNTARPELSLAPLPYATLWVGAVLGVAGIPLYAVGYRAASRPFARGVGARLVVYPGVLAALLGAVIHGLTAVEIRRALDSALPTRPPLEAVAASGAWLVGLWLVVGAMFLVASVAFMVEQLRTTTGSARHVAFANPFLVTVVLGGAAMSNEWLRSFLAPAAPNVAHVVFFLALWGVTAPMRGLAP